jgi:hypothetical protein
MIRLQIVPKPGTDAYLLLRSKVLHEARTWSWANKAKTRLRHNRIEGGYIEVGRAEGVVVARVQPREQEDSFFLVEKLVGRLVAWFHEDIAAINIQLGEDPPKKRRRPRR